MAQQKDTKTGKWMYYGSYVDRNGKRIQYKKRGFETKKEARKAEDDFREKIENPESHMTFKELSDIYIRYAQKRVKAASIKSDEYLLKLINEEIGNKQLSHINKKMLQNFIDKLDEAYSKRYVEKIFYCMNKVFKYGLENGIIINNPLISVKPDQRRNEAEKEMLFWEPDDFNKFIKVVDDSMFKCVFMTLYYMGVRRGEMMALTWADVNFKNKTIRIEKTINRSNGIKVTTPKTKNSYRTITMPDILVEEMKFWEATVKSFVGYNANGYVFGNDQPIAPETLRRKFHEYIKQANMKQRPENQIPVIRIHDLRHSHASFLINNMSAGFTDFDIAKRLGDTVATLHNTYAHWFKAADKGIIDFMNSTK